MNERWREQNPIRRDPPEESTDLYDGLCVQDERVGAAITIGRSRLPVWAIIHRLIDETGWAEVLDGWPQVAEEYGWTREQMSDFLHYLTQSRGEFGRLLLVLAQAEQSATRDRAGGAWCERPELRRRVQEQLQRCLDALERAEKARE